MKNLFLTLVIICSFSVIFAQVSVDEVPLASLDAQYIHVFVAKGLGHKGHSINIEYGPNRIPRIVRRMRLRESPDGRPLYFESAVEAINFMHNNGYSLVQILTNAEGEPVSYYMVKRERELLQAKSKTLHYG